MRANGPLNPRNNRLERQRSLRAMTPQNLFRKIQPFQDISGIADYLVRRRALPQSQIKSAPIGEICGSSPRLKPQVSSLFPPASFARFRLFADKKMLPAEIQKDSTFERA